MQAALSATASAAPNARVDLLDFDQTALYFDDPVPSEVEALIAQAAGLYGEEKAEALLLRAYFLAPEQLSVLVALYRYYFYQHRLADALKVGQRALAVVGVRLGLPQDWTRLHPEHVGHAVMRSMGLTRFYLSVLKATAYILLRLDRRGEGRAMLAKLVELDSHDRMGAAALLAVVEASEREALAS